MSYTVLTVIGFDEWWQGLKEKEQIDVAAAVGLLKAKGVSLGYPYSSSIHGSRHGHMRELRVQHRGRPIRVLYAFDPNRNALLLLGGDKSGDKRWYEKNIPIADARYEKHLEDIKYGKAILKTTQGHAASRKKSRRH
jgi:hypothetical protein